ncbi:MAG: leucine-rich repeat protein [Lachnospiraceae bacterium]|nr:leucine-rich repeat protein [Lachnospiraceae bacterium]
MKQNGNYRIQKLKFVVLTMFVCVLLLSQNFTVLTQAATARATTMKLDSFKGSVTVKTMNGSQRKASKGMRLLNGYEVSTADGSEAFISLDNSKAVKLDAKSSVQVRQAGNRLELMIKSGKVFFNVSKPLKSNETLNVRSSTMVAGVRGTSGYATVHEEETKMYLLEGNLGMTRTNPVTNKVETVQIKGGEVASSYKYEQKKVDVTIEKFTEVDVPAFVVEEVAKDVELQKKIDTEELSALSSEKLLEVKKYYDQGLTQEEIIEKVEEEEKKEEETNGEKNEENTVDIPSYVPSTPLSPAPTTKYAIQFLNDSNEVISEVTWNGFEPPSDGGKWNKSISFRVLINNQPVSDAVSAANSHLYQPKYTLTESSGNAGSAAFGTTADDVWGAPVFTVGAAGVYQLKVELLDPTDATKVLASNTLTYTIVEAKEDDIFTYSTDEDGNSIIIDGLTDYGRSLKNITIPKQIDEKTVLAIASELFSNNTNIQTVTIEADVTTIPSWVFSGCNSLTSVTLPNSVTTIEDGAFYDCDKLKSFDLPTTVTAIGYGAFQGCQQLKSINLPAGLTTIDSGAFKKCGLTEITWPKGVETVGGGIFSGCVNLTSVTVQEECTYLTGSMFLDCTSLTTVTLPASIEKIDDSAFSGCSSLTTITLPSNLTVLGEKAFENCSKLQSIALPDGVTSICGSTFSGCTALSDVTLSKNTTYIGMYAFSGCSSLTEITLPDTVTSIEEEAFPNTVHVVYK